MSKALKEEEPPDEEEPHDEEEFSMMHEILTKAYAESIVESLKMRNTGSEVPFPFAAVDLGEEILNMTDVGDTVYRVKVKFFWETTNRLVGTVERSLETELQYHLGRGQVRVAPHEWTPLSIEDVNAAADWIVQNAR